MMKFFGFVLFLLLSSSAFAQVSHNIRVLSKINVSGGRAEMHYEDKIIPVQFDRPELMRDLPRGPFDAVVEGVIGHVKVPGEASQFRPVFIITGISPLSLQDLGLVNGMGDIEVFQSKNPSSPSEYFRSPRFPVTSEVATALTLTGTFLLMDSLAGSHGTDPSGRHDLNKALLISAGSMATLLFLYEQLSGKTKP